VTRAISEILPDILLSVPGCPPPHATQALSSAVREFLDATGIWKVWVAPIDTVADQAVYAFPNHLMDPLEAWARTYAIDMLRWVPTGRELEFRTAQQLQAADREWRTRTAPVPAAWTHEIDDGTGAFGVRLYPTPSEIVVDALEARLVMSTHTYSGIGMTAADLLAVVLPDEIFHRYRDAFMYGALARLLLIPKRDWTDLGLARSYSQMFSDAKLSAKSTSDVDFNEPGLTVTYGGY
jgi:hypothetical protein